MEPPQIIWARFKAWIAPEHRCQTATGDYHECAGNGCCVPLKLAHRSEWSTSRLGGVPTMATFPAVRVIFFDFGFTLWNEERAWTEWAQWLGVPTFEFFAKLGSVIERGEHHHRVFEIFRPGIDISQERQRFNGAGRSDAFRPEDLYPDVVPSLKGLCTAGYRTGVAGNHFSDFATTTSKNASAIRLYRLIGRMGNRKAFAGILCEDREGLRRCAGGDRIRRRPSG